MGVCGTFGFQARWAFEHSTGDPSSSTVDASSVVFPVISDTLGLSESYGSSTGNRGTRGEFAEDTWVESQSYEGEIVLEASPKVLGFFLRHITGDSTSAHTMQESLGDGFDYIRNDGVSSKLYTNVLVSRAVLKAAGGGVATLTLSVVGRNETIGTFTSFAAIGTTDAYAPYIASQIALTAGSNPTAAREIDDIELTIDHFLEPRRRMSLGPQCYVHGARRKVSFSTTSVWDSTAEAEFYGNDQAGLAATLALSRGNLITVFILNRLQIPKNTPGVSGAGEIVYPITGDIRGSGTTGELTITHDETP